MYIMHAIRNNKCILACIASVLRSGVYRSTKTFIHRANE